MIILSILSTFSRKTPTSNIFPSPTVVPLISQPAIKNISPKDYISQDQYLESGKISNITFSFKDPSFPKDINVYSGTKLPISQDDAFITAKAFPFSSPPQDNGEANIETWVSNDLTQTLNIYLKSEHISFINSFVPAKPDIGSPSLKMITSKDEAIVTAENFLKGKGLWKDGIYAEKDKISLHKGDFESGSVQNISFSEAEIIDIPFGRKINNTQVLYQYDKLSTVEILIDKFGTVRKLEYQYTPVQIGPRITLLNTLEAKNKILNGEGIIIKFGEDGMKTTTNSISSVNLSTMELNYLYDIGINSLVPVFVFRGDGTSEAGKKANTTIVLPALK
jgi:hypothetical protein